MSGHTWTIVNSFGPHISEKTSEFWKLLYYLLKMIGENKKCPVIDLAHHITYVKAAVSYYGYGFLDFYQLPADGSRGSRDLLLVFSWLLQKTQLLEELLDRQRVHVEDQVSLCMCKQTGAVKPPGTPDSQEGMHAMGMDVRYLQCLHGKLRFRWKSLHSAQQERCAFLYKIHSNTRGCHNGQSINHLSATEMRLIQDSVQCNEFIQLLEQENMRLEAYLNWKQLEPFFWQWMESVLTAKLQDTQDPVNANDIKAIECFLHQSGDHGDSVIFREMDNLSSKILKLQMKLQGRQKTKVKKTDAQERRSQSPTRRLESVFPTWNDMEKKLGELQARVNHQQRRHGHARLALRSPLQFPSAKQDSESLSASEVIMQLRTEETALRRELQEMQQLCRESLAEVVERQDGVICLPPMQRGSTGNL
ncbi:tubulin epsilon and delta complex protein 1 isoform X2 [Mobula hypostoma]|uniref:tubulin epsilon and delta complex protein 1 isoform X2 n=1 Tax=Mobula hypostoma TaxID=723540 RepID=UPI002FC32261